MLIADTGSCSRTELAACFGVSTRTISRWKSEGCPVKSDGRFVLPKVVAWRLEQETLAMTPSSGQTDSPWLERYRRERALQARDERRKRRGRLVEQEEHIAVAAAAAAQFRNAVRSWRCRLPPMLVGKSEDDMLPIIEAEMDTALTELAKQLQEAPATAGTSGRKDTHHGKVTNRSTSKSRKKNHGQPTRRVAAGSNLPDTGKRSPEAKGKRTAKGKPLPKRVCR